MPKWNEFVPSDFEYDFENDELQGHHVTIDEAVQCFSYNFTIRRNKRFRDRFKLLGNTDTGRNLCIIFQLKRSNVIRIITGWEV
jgi:uncharacterized DUF497 family protein